MRRAIGLAAFLLLFGLALVIPGPAAAQKKPEKNEDPDKKTDPLVKVGVVSGKITNLYEDKREINLAVSVPKPNPSAANSIAQAQQQLNQARARNDRQGIINAQKALQQAQNNMYTSETKNVKFVARDDVVVRRMQPGDTFDDKGRIKKPTAKDLKDLKGPGNLPGYKAEYGDLKTDQVVQVTLVTRKSAMKAKAPAKKKGKDDELTNPDLLGDNSAQISLILILAEGKARP